MSSPVDSLPCAPIDLFVFFLTIKQTLPTLLISQIVFANLSIQASWKSNCSFAIWDHRSKESHDSDIPSGVLSGGESKEVGVDGLQAQAAHRSQCDAEEWNAVVDGGESVDLMFKTVAQACPSYRGKCYITRCNSNCALWTVAQERRGPRVSSAR